MRLDEFKRKHYQDVAGHDKPLPWCSDTRPGERIEDLMSEPYFASKGLVNCRLNFPFQEIQGEPNPTVAGVETKRLLYKFVDEQLYQIIASFSTDSFTAVYDAMCAKYGPPHSQDTQKQCIWSNEVSSIFLTKGRRKNQWTTDPSTLLFLHHKLSELADSRRPGPAVSDL